MTATRASRLKGFHFASCAVSALVLATGAHAQEVRVHKISGGDLKSSSSEFARESERALASHASDSTLADKATSDGQSLVVAQAAEPPGSPRPQRVAAVEARTGASQPEPTTVEEVVVSASRIRISGYDQPTPVTVISEAAMEREAKTDLRQTFQDLPSFGDANSTSTNQGSQSSSGGGAGANNIALRNLGASRTLVLVNGVRVVGTELGEPATVDLNMIPAMLLQRVDIVTGGASAAWGSDAVAGVVNFVMNDRFEGLKLNLEGASNLDWNHSTFKGELAYGRTFDGTRGHYILGLGYQNSPQSPYASDMRWRKGDYVALVNNPAYTATNGQPQLITAHHVGISNVAPGGLINACQPAGIACPIRGTQFVGLSGTPAPFNFGDVSGIFTTNGSGVDPILLGRNNLMAVPSENFTVYNRLTYALTDSITAKLELNGTRLSVHNTGSPYIPQVTVRADNPYLDPALAAQMAANRITSFTEGLSYGNNVPVDSFNDDDSHSLINRAKSTRYFYRGLAQLDGSIGEKWKWTSYLQYSSSERESFLQSVYLPNYNQAVDSVRVTAANVGSSGLAIGSIACRSTLNGTDVGLPRGACVPFNPFGTAPLPADVLNYISPVMGSALAQRQYLRNQLVTASASVSGELFNLPAGPVAVATGLDYLWTKTKQTSGAGSYAFAYNTGNFQFFEASDSSQEAFVEVNAPILKDRLVKSLEINAAARITHYDSSGTVKTWKLGAVAQLTDDIRIRATRSLDIRAPGVFALFNPGSFSSASQPVPGQTFNANSFSGGNPNLKPEEASTWTVGAVLTPRFIPGFSASVDYYSINIDKVFFSPTSIQSFTACQAGIQQFCDLFVRNAAGAVTTVKIITINASSLETRGVDVQADYHFPAFDGNIALNFVAGYQPVQKTTSIVGTTDAAGSLNYDTGGNGSPKLRAVLRATYDRGPFSATVQTRYVGSANINNLYHEGGGPNSIDNNSVPAVAYLDLRASYQFGSDKRWQVYGAIDNLLNKDPPVVPYTSLSPTFQALSIPEIAAYYDVLGVQVRAGVRVTF
jgi:iron complex outermembrane receptor protein